MVAHVQHPASERTTIGRTVVVLHNFGFKLGMCKWLFSYYEGNENKEVEAQEKGLPAPPPPNGPPAIMHRDPTRNNKRSHRKVHGKISLQALTQRIGQRWKALGARDKQRYIDWAYQDKMRLSKEQEHATEGQDEKCWAPQGEKQELDTNAQEPLECRYQLPTFDSNEFPRPFEPSPAIGREIRLPIL